MPLSYFIKINKLRPNGNACVVKKTQKSLFSVADSRQLLFSIRLGFQKVTTSALRTQDFGWNAAGVIFVAQPFVTPSPASV